MLLNPHTAAIDLRVPCAQAVSASVALLVVGVGVFRTRMHHGRMHRAEFALVSSNVGAPTAARMKESRFIIDSVHDEPNDIEFVAGGDVGTPACHAPTHVRKPCGATVVAWYGGLRDDGKDTAIYVSQRFSNGTWLPPAKVAKVGAL